MKKKDVKEEHVSIACASRRIGLICLQVDSRHDQEIVLTCTFEMIFDQSKRNTVRSNK